MKIPDSQQRLHDSVIMETAAFLARPALLCLGTLLYDESLNSFVFLVHQAK